jgi:hypothetical protein
MRPEAEAGLPEYPPTPSLPPLTRSARGLLPRKRSTARGGHIDGGISSQRAAHNQSLYRSINEKIEELNQTLAGAGFESNAWVCECADTQCTILVTATVPEYETVRSNPRTFIISPGHLYADVERVLSENDRFMIVEKLDNGGQIAESLDPRH